MNEEDPFSLARHNRLEKLKALLADSSIDVDMRDPKGNTLLLVACQNGLKRVAKLMLKMVDSYQSAIFPLHLFSSNHQNVVQNR